jgi:hypothetical protein
MIPCAPFTTRWGRTKPPPGVAVDRGHPLGSRLFGCWLFNEQAGKAAVNLGTGPMTAVTGSLAWAGGASSWDGSKTAYAGLSTWTPPASASVFVRFKQTSFSNRAIVGDRDNSNIFLYLDSGRTDVSAYVGGTNLTSGPGRTIVNGRWYTVAITASVGGPCALYQDGTLTAAGTGGSFATTEFRIGVSTNSFWGGFLGLIDCVHLYHRTLSAAEIAWLHAEPYAMLRPVVRRSFSGGGGATALFRRTAFLRAGSRGAWN